MLVKSADDVRPWYQPSSARDQATIAFDLRRDLTLQGMDVDPDTLDRFLGGDDAARPLSYPATGIEDSGPVGRYCFESREYERRRLFGTQTNTVTIACMQAAVPSLLLEDERAAIQQVLLHAPFRTKPEVPLRRGALLTAFFGTPASLDEAVTAAEEAFRGWADRPERGRPIDA